MQINIIIPAYNEAARIGATLAKLDVYLSTTPLGEETEVRAYVVDDGSGDNTAALVGELTERYSFLKLLTYAANRGKGYAFRYGVAHSEPADYYYLADADGSGDWQILANFVVLAQAEQVDCVIASRAIAGAHASRTEGKQFASTITNLAIRTILRIPYRDTQCGYKLFRRSCLPYITALKLDGFGFDFELLKRLHDAKLNIREVPVDWEDRAGSKVHFRHYFTTLQELLYVRFH